MLIGRLGLAGARVPQADRHGVLWLERGKLYVDRGNLAFVTAGSDHLKAGDYQIPYQDVSSILLGPGTTISHDALRILARHQTGLVAVGTGGVRLYASMPFGPDRSILARKQVAQWADTSMRLEVTRRMYGLRLGERLPQADLNALRGIEGSRMKAVYQMLADQYGVEWRGRRYDRSNPEGDDAINRAINHAAVAVRSAAMIAVAVTGTVPQLGFIHEASGVAFALDVADLVRSGFTLPCAFKAVKEAEQLSGQSIERITRRLVGREMRQSKLVAELIDRIKEVLDGDDDSRDA